MSSSTEPTPRSRVRRLPRRGSHDRVFIDSVLDEGIVAHVGFVHEGSPFVLPMGYARDGDRLLLHGSSASRLMRLLASGVEAAVTVTLLDGLVFARSHFHHSMNYRSVVVLGRTAEVARREDKQRALDVLLERLIPGRHGGARPPNGRELDATLVASMPLTEATAKSRRGPPADDAEDLGLPHWAGVVPVRTSFGPPQSAPDLRGGIEIPVCAECYERKSTDG